MTKKPDTSPLLVDTGLYLVLFLERTYSVSLA